MVQGLSKGTPLVLMVTIVDRGNGEKVSDFLRSEGVSVNLLTYGRGTASSEIMEYLGLADTEREVLLSTMPFSSSKELIKRINDKFRLEKPGEGIIFTISISSLCGKLAAKHLRGSRCEGDDTSMEKSNYELIVAIVTRGYADDVMAVARKAKATGGTVIHARGTGSKEAEKFFGIIVQPEKEMLLILTQKEIKNDIMQAIIKNYGSSTEARSMLFSLPVTDVDGLPVGFSDK